MNEKEITIKVAPDVQVLCDVFGITPEALLTHYMNDLCSMQGNGGSDERRMAKDYFTRTYLSRQDEFTISYAEVIMEDFETLYQNAYPSLDNTNWKEQRTELLKDMYKQLITSKEAFKNKIHS